MERRIGGEGDKEDKGRRVIDTPRIINLIKNRAKDERKGEESRGRADEKGRLG